MHLLKFSPLTCQKTDQTSRVPMFASVPLCYRNHIGAVLKKKKKIDCDTWSGLQILTEPKCVFSPETVTRISPACTNK